jgi:3-deoxy-D-manno-octulosonate 8-phosphate phosphatase (KDO 8-P phosphatase)
VALACAPRTAQVEVLALAHFVPSAAAGHGAARALCDLVLLATGQYARLWREQSA